MKDNAVVVIANGVVKNIFVEKGIKIVNLDRVDASKQEHLIQYVNQCEKEMINLSNRLSLELQEYDSLKRRIINLGYTQSKYEEYSNEFNRDIILKGQRVILKLILNEEHTEIYDKRVIPLDYDSMFSTHDDIIILKNAMDMLNDDIAFVTNSDNKLLLYGGEYSGKLRI